MNTLSADFKILFISWYQGDFILAIKEQSKPIRTYTEPLERITTPFTNHGSTKLFVSVIPFDMLHKKNFFLYKFATKRAKS